MYFVCPTFLIQWNNGFYQHILTTFRAYISRAKFTRLAKKCKYASKGKKFKKSSEKILFTFVWRAPVVSKTNVILESAVEIKRIVIGEYHLVSLFGQSHNRFVIVVLKNIKIFFKWTFFMFCFLLGRLTNKLEQYFSVRLISTWVCSPDLNCCLSRVASGSDNAESDNIGVQESNLAWLWYHFNLSLGRIQSLNLIHVK